VLPRNFKPAKRYDLIRLGNPNDGGYLVCRASVAEARTLLSFGINDDWSFDKAFCASNPVPVEAFDHTISTRLFGVRAAQSMAAALVFFWMSPRSVIHAWRHARTFVSYLLFFRGERKLNRIPIGGAEAVSMSLGDVMRKTDQRPVFIKCDIEGAEYDLFADIVAHAGDISGLVMEFHDVDVHLAEMSAFIDRFPLELVHIHPNNCGGTGEDGNPKVLELTFSRHPTVVGKFPVLPHPCDAANGAALQEPALIFET
tara:strand:+ start:2631 stop:3398 length:768 start_codon:yes stop_codon:yes gene_type:complete